MILAAAHHASQGYPVFGLFIILAVAGAFVAPVNALSNFARGPEGPFRRPPAQPLAAASHGSIRDMRAIRSRPVLLVLVWVALSIGVILFGLFWFTIIVSVLVLVAVGLFVAVRVFDVSLMPYTRHRDELDSSQEDVHNS